MIYMYEDVYHKSDAKLLLVLQTIDIIKITIDLKLLIPSLLYIIYILEDVAHIAAVKIRTVFAEVSMLLKSESISTY